MIYLFYGSDVDKVRMKAFEWVAKARTKEPNLSYMRLTKEEVSREALADAAASHSLFAQRTLTLLDDPFSSAKAGGDAEVEENTADFLGDNQMAMLAESENVIVILAPKLAAARVKKIAAHSKIAYEFNKTAIRDHTRGFNADLVNAFATRSPEKLWVEVVRAFRAGDAPEAVHGLLHWKARDLMEKGGRGWAPADAREFSVRLITLLRESRQTGMGLSISLEQFALSL